MTVVIFEFQHPYSHPMAVDPEETPVELWLGESRDRPVVSKW